MVLVFDEWVSLLLSMLPGVGDWWSMIDGPAD